MKAIQNLTRCCIDLHGCHPDDVPLEEILRQAWECGYTYLELIHGHGRWRGISPGFVHTNTGFAGLCIRGYLKGPGPYHHWTTIQRGDPGTTTVKLKPNRIPSRVKINIDLPLRFAGITVLVSARLYGKNGQEVTCGAGAAHTTLRRN